MQLTIVLAVLAVLIPLVLARPIRGLYLLFASATVLEIFPLGFPDSLTDVVPFFQNLNNYGIAGVSISPAEILMVIGLLGWWASAAATPHLRLWPSGRLLPAYVIYIGVVLLAALRGLLSGGDVNITLWELRPQVYGFILFLLAASLIRERTQVLWLAGILFVGCGLKAVVGFNRYFFTLHRDLGNLDSILAHEESYFLALFLIGLLCVLIWYRRKALVWTLLMMSPVVAITLLENRRRAALIALGAAVVVVLILGIRFDSRVRTRLAFASIVGAVVVSGFMAAFWNQQSGLAGQIVRPVHSLFQPDDRDYSSNLYRQNENANLLYTYDTNRVLGVGFGSPMDVVFPLADISQAYPLWQFIPHNTLLWIGMRMGLIGFMAFFGLLGMAILEGVHQVSARSDPLVKGVAVFLIAALVAELVVAYGDLQLENYRNMIFMGAVLGLLDALPRIPDATAAREAARAVGSVVRHARLARVPVRSG